MNDLVPIGRVLILLGVVLVLVGVGVMVLGRVPRLPGDIVIRRDGFVLYVPIVTSLVLSLLLTVLLTLLLGRR